MICQLIRKISIKEISFFTSRKNKKIAYLKRKFAVFIQSNPMKHSFQHSKSFRYFTKGNIDKSKTLIYVLHGYGQLAEYFLKKFDGLAEDFYVVAPEGMHRFYLNGSSGRVGASWMTKEERETDISDNISWLNALNNKILAERTFDKIIVLGFSQGGATAARWYYSNRGFNQLIMWASVFPPDLSLNQELKKDSQNQNYFVLGDLDEYFQDDLFQKELKTFEDLGFKTRVFNGKHDIEIVTLQKILEVQ